MNDFWEGVKKKRTYGDMGGNDVKQKRTYSFGSNFKYLTFNLTNEKFPIHLKTVKVKCPRKMYYLWIPTSNVRGRKRLQILRTSFMDGPNTLKGWNDLLDYLQTNNAFRKNEFINYNLDDSTLLPLNQRYNKMFWII